MTVLWVTPMRALARDSAEALAVPIREMGLAWTIELRTGDTPQSIRRKQKDRLPTVLVTTPESLTLLLSYPDAREKFKTLRCVVADEWHELMGSKRGVQLELALARLRSWLPALRTWGVSATLGNLEQARDVLLGPDHPRAASALVRGLLPKSISIETLIPPDIERFPWAGHLGIRLSDHVADAVRNATTTLLFTNTRSQAEIWFSRLIKQHEDLLGAIAIHHGSLDKALRAKVESMLAEGRLACVVCTSSLDLGVDFQPVDQVLQLGSPKGVARLLQRAGRSGHRPGASSRIVGVPTNAFELIEFAAARDAATMARVEARPPIERPLDVLVQHLVTIACAGGFVEDDLKREVRSTHSFMHLTDEHWAWCMDFVTRGGSALSAYPNFARITCRDHRWQVASDRTARTHRLTIGTISAETSLSVKLLSGRNLGHIEENFVARIVAGDRFIFAGRVLEFVRLRENTVFVQPSKNTSGLVPRWDGGRFSLSSELAALVRNRLDQARRHIYDGPEMQAIKPLLELQMLWSQLPSPGELLVELIPAADAFHLVLYPFAGRTAHEGLGALLAHRFAQRSPRTITATATDYGVCLASPDPFDVTASDLRELLATDNLVEDLVACVNTTVMARRQFRDIARIAGLVVPGYPGAKKTARHLQASSEMFFDVFEEFDPGSPLLDQARREVLAAQLETTRLTQALLAARSAEITIVRPKCMTPMAFPIWAERLRANSLSSESFDTQVRRMALALEDAAKGGPSAKLSVPEPKVSVRSRSKRPVRRTRL